MKRKKRELLVDEDFSREEVIPSQAVSTEERDDQDDGMPGESEVAAAATAATGEKKVRGERTAAASQTQQKTELPTPLWEQKYPIDTGSCIRGIFSRLRPDTLAEESVPTLSGVYTRDAKVGFVIAGLFEIARRAEGAVRGMHLFAPARDYADRKIGTGMLGDDPEHSINLRQSGETLRVEMGWKQYLLMAACLGIKMSDAALDSLRATAGKDDPFAEWERISQAITPDPCAYGAPYKPTGTVSDVEIEYRSALKGEPDSHKIKASLFASR